MSFSSRSFAFALSVPCLVPAVALAQDSQSVFSLPSQSLTSALTVFSKQTGMYVAFDANVTNRLRSAPLYGRMDNLTVRGSRHELRTKRNFAGVVDSITYDDGGSYSNDLNSLGGATRLEWHPENSGFSAPVMGYAYERWENSFLEHNEYLLDDTGIWNQTPTSGREYIYRARTIGRKDNWLMNTDGVLGNLSWHDNISTPKLRAGYTWEDYYNHEPYVAARVYPKENAKGAVFADYTINRENVANLVDIIDMNKLLNSGYAFQTVEQEDDRDHEGVTNVRLDYTRNLSPDFHGFGFASGFEWRSLNANNSSDQLWYKPGGNAASSMFIPDMQNPNGPFFDLENFPWNKQTLDSVKSKNYTELAYFRYREQLFDGYVSLHYKWRNSQIIAGVRADSVNFNALTPGIDSSSNPTGKLEKNNGGYINPLPSVTFVHEFPKNLILHAVYSQSVGRPQPTDLAQAAQYSCGSSQDTQTATVNCSIVSGQSNRDALQIA